MTSKEEIQHVVDETVKGDQQKSARRSAIQAEDECLF